MEVGWGTGREKKREESVTIVQTSSKEGLNLAGFMVQEETGTGWVRAQGVVRLQS